VIVGQPISTGTMFEAALVKNGVDTSMIEGIGETYDIPLNLTVHNVKANVPVLWWRGAGSTHTAFVTETLLDDAAHAARVDSVSYRRKLLGWKDGRHLAALDLAVAKSGYGVKKLPKGHGWGVAVHGLSGGVVAYVVEATVEDGVPRLHKVTAAIDYGTAVNPLTIEAQIQGAVLMALGTTLPGGGHHAQGRCRRTAQFRRLHGCAHARHAARGCVHRAIEPSADWHGRSRPAAVGAGLCQRHLQCHRQALAQVAVRPQLGLNAG
jgi:CO/xanthine dehydrogenase Mo-binding subunit